MKGEKGDEMSELRCGGCGAVIQSEDKNKPKNNVQKKNAFKNSTKHSSPRV